MASMQIQNGHGHVAQEEYSTQNEFLTEESTCSVCGKQKPNEMVDLSANEVMKDTLITYYKMRPSQVQATLSALCVQCVYKINIQREMARTLELRLHQRNINSKLLDTTTTVPIIARNTRARLKTGIVTRDIGDYKISTKYVKSILKKVPGKASSFTQKKDKSEEQSSSIPTACTPTTAITPSPKESIKNLTGNENSAHAKAKSLPLSTLETCSTTSTHSAQNGSMLEVICERTESALITESGCHVSHHQQITKLIKRFTCCHCDRTYLREDFYKKHIRRCKRQRPPYAKCNTQRRKAVSSKTDDHHERRRLHTKVPAKAKSRIERCYYCAYCDETRNSLAAIREHQLEHLPHLTCSSCGQVFNAQHNYEFHIAECNSKLEALNSSQTKEQQTHRTRRSLARSLRKNHAATDRSAFKDIDGVSVADSMFTQRMSNTNNWIQTHIDDDEDQDWVDGTNEFNDSFNCDPQISTYKEYDLYLLDIFKFQVQFNYFRCFEAECEFTANDLFAAILHDYKEHWNRSWYFCRKCDCMFTKKVHLDYHLYLQNSGRYVCFRCAEVFLFQHELDRHLIRHDKSINFRCNYCHLEYLTELELIKHCDHEKHNPNDERTLVTIDKTMTIVNSMPISINNDGATEMCGTTSASSIRFMNICPPSIPKTENSINFSSINRHVIGDFEFKNQIIPNCAGCKYED